MSDDVRQDGDAEQGGQPQRPWPAAPRRSSLPLPVPGDSDPEQGRSPVAESAHSDSPASAPPAPHSPFAPPSTWMPPLVPPQPSPMLPKTFESPFAPPVYEAPTEPTSAPPVTVPASAPPASAPPASAPPASAPPASAPPASAPPASVPPAPALPWMSGELPTVTPQWAPSPSAPASSPLPPSPPTWDRSWGPQSVDPYASDESRIYRSPDEPRRWRFTTGLLIGLVVALLAGVGAYFLGTATSGKPVATPSPTPSPSLPLFEATQKRLNEAKFIDDLVPLAQPWLPYMNGCLADTDARAPKLPSDERRHVLCQYNGVTITFGLYVSEAALTAGRTYRQGLKLPDDLQVPGQEAPSQKAGGVSHVQGEYVEYALKGRDGRPLCGIWWNREGSPAAVFMEALCNETLGGSWTPLRDLWQRYS